MDPTKLSRSAIDGIRYLQALFLAVAGVTPVIGVYADDVSQAAENLIAAVTALAGVFAVLLEVKKKANTTPLADPKDDTGRALEPVVTP